MHPHPLAKFFGKIGYIWANMVGFGRNLEKLRLNLLRFGQNQNLASPKTFDLLKLWPSY